MTDIQIPTPDGTIEVPDSAHPDVIRGLIAKHAPDPQSRETALRAWADQYVERERSQGGMLQVGKDVVRNLARGTPVGSWLDEANAATHAAMGGQYDEAKAYQNATDRAVDKQGGTLATKIVGGVASLPIMPAVAAVRGATMLPRVINGMVNGTVYGTVSGAGEGEGKERIVNAGTGAGIGGTLGTVAPVVAKGIGNAYGAVRDYFKGVPAPLDQYSRGAVNKVVRAGNDDSVLNSGLVPKLDTMGPEAVIGDMGPNLRGQVGALARTPGKNQATVLNTLDQRAAGAGGRISQEVDRGLGRPVDLPSAERTIDAFYKRQADPHYTQFHGTPIPYTPELERIVNVLKNEPSVLKDARRMVDMDPSPGAKSFFAKQDRQGNWVVERVPNAQEWDYIKQALDGLAHGATATKNDTRIYGHWANRIKDEVDNILSPGNPAASPWAQGRALAGEGITTGKAIDEGRQAFSKGVSPDEMRDTMRNYGPAQTAGYTLGARQNVRDIAGNASTKWGANDDSAMRSRLGSEYAREKLNMLERQPGGGDRIANRLDTETTFDKTRTAASGNSVTAAMQAAQKEFPGAVDNIDVGRSLGSQGGVGLLLRAGNKVANALTGGMINERRAAQAADAASILVNNGYDRNAVAKALVDYANSRASTAAGKATVERIAQSLLEGSRSALIDEGVKYKQTMPANP
jgi:hypothetical protein